MVRFTAPFLMAAWLCGLPSSSGSRAEFGLANAGREPNQRVQIKCPSQVFEEFLQAFRENTEIQRRFTKVPFEMRYMALEEGTGKWIKGLLFQKPILKRERFYSFPQLQKYSGTAGIFPTESEQHTDGTIMTIHRASDDASSRDVIVRMSVPDSDVSVAYHFAKTRACWRLHLIDSK